MKLITQKNVKMFSSTFHGTLASIVALALLTINSYDYTVQLFILWCLSVVCACCFGCLFGSWYVPMKGERWFFEPYVITPIASLISALVPGLLFMLFTETTASAQNIFDPGSVLGGSIFIY